MLFKSTKETTEDNCYFIYYLDTFAMAIVLCKKRTYVSYYNHCI